MFRNTSRLLCLINKQLQSNSPVIVEVKNYLAVAPCARSYKNKLFYSTDKASPASKNNIASSIDGPKTAPIVNADEAAQKTEDEAKKKAANKTMKYTFIVMGLTALCGGTYLILELGKPQLDEDGNIMRDDLSRLPKLQQYVYRALRELDFYRRLLKEPSRDKLLPDILAYPYYQPPYTLVLEFTDILVHPDWTYKTGWRFKKRPGLDQFLDSLSGVYEIVVYTAEQGMTVFPLLEAVDPKNLISYKLVRDATHFVGGHHVKDLDRLNRDLNRVIVVDWDRNSVKMHPNNLLRIPRWTGDDEDTSLIDLAIFLRTIAQTEINDVRDVLKYYAKYDDPLLAFRDKQKKYYEELEMERAEKLKDVMHPKNKWVPSFLNKIF